MILFEFAPTFQIFWVLYLAKSISSYVFNFALMSFKKFNFWCKLAICLSIYSQMY